MKQHALMLVTMPCNGWIGKRRIGIARKEYRMLAGVAVTVATCPAARIRAARESLRVGAECDD
jgi:hypothetical protein